MMKFKRIVLNVFAVFSLAVMPAAVPAAVYAGAPSCGNTDTAKGQVLQGIGLTGNDCDDRQVNNLFATIVNILSIITGILAVIAIIYAGAKYITSGGSSEKISNAKNTLIYALVGLAVASLAQLLVRFVLYQTSR